MKMKLSVLVSDLSGSSGDVVASKTHGIGYFRRRVIPKYSRTLVQDLVRLNMARVPALWRNLPAKLVTLINASQVGTTLSGFNRFAKSVLTSISPDTITGIPAGPVELLTGVGSIAVCVLVSGTGVGEGTVSFAWTQGAAPAGSFVVPYVVEQSQSAEYGEPYDVIYLGTPVAIATGSGAVEDLPFVGGAAAGVFVIDTAAVADATLVSDSTALFTTVV